MFDNVVATTEQITGAPQSVIHRSPEKRIGWILSLAVPIALWFAPLPLDALSKHALAVASFMIIAWITEVLPHALTGWLGATFSGY